MSVKPPVNDNRDSNEFVRELFTSEIKEPFSHNIAFNDVNDVDKLFEKIKQIFMIGAMIHCGDLEKKVIFMDKMTPNIFEKLNSSSMQHFNLYWLTFVCTNIHDL